MLDDVFFMFHKFGDNIIIYVLSGSPRITVAGAFGFDDIDFLSMI